MFKSVLWFLTVVIVSADCSAESTPAISKTSGFTVPNNTQAYEHEKKDIRGNDDAPHEERESFAIESIILSVKASDESLPGTIHTVNMVDVPQFKERNKALPKHEANMMDVPQIKVRNIVLATRMEKLGIDIDGVVLVTKSLKYAFRDFSLNNLEWMVLGKVYFEKAGSTGYRSLSARELFKELKMEIIDNGKITEWTKRLNSFHIGARNVFGKMLLLLQHGNELNLALADAAKMAFGSELLNKKKKLPRPRELIKAVGEQNVDTDLVESILRQDKGSRKNDVPSFVGPFAIESITSSVKTADESLPRPRHAATVMDVSEIKERNIVLATRMETLGIDIDGVVLVTKAFTSAFQDFSLNNLEWMVLGKVYFEKDGSRTGYRVLYSNELFKVLNMQIIDHVELKNWTRRLKNFNVQARMVFGKMLWLLRHENELHLDLADAAKMAFGSEFLNTRKNLPTSGEILKVVGEHNFDKDLVESVLRQDKDSRKRKEPTVQGPFAIESFTPSVKTADESLPHPKHAATMMDVSEIKERNEVLATRLEILGIDIDGVVLVTEALESEFERSFSRNNLEWMVLGKVYIGKAGSTDYRSLRARELFKELNMEIIDKKEFEKWTRRINIFHVEARRVFGKMLWLLQHENELNLALADAAKMAFGSEYLNTRKKLPTSGEILKAVGVHNVDKDLVESVLRQDKDSRIYKAPTVLGPFAIESFTPSVKTADESLPRPKHAATMMDVSEIKERNEVLATRLEKLGIDIGGIVFVTEALEFEFGAFFSRNNLGWMVLGKIFFKKAGRTDYKDLSSKQLFKKLNMEITNYEEIKKWAARFTPFHVQPKQVFAKTLWLLQKHKELSLDLADAAKMAFGSEYLETRELPFSDEVLEAMTQHNVDKDGTESLIPLDTTMTDIAGDKQLKTKRKNVGEKRSNKKRKLA